MFEWIKKLFGKKIEPIQVEPVKEEPKKNWRYNIRDEKGRFCKKGD